MANISLIADKAGVSMATVSRTLRNPGSLKTPNQRRIIEVAKNLGYDFEFRETDSAKLTRQIVFLSFSNTLSPDTLHSYDTYMPIVKGISGVIDKVGYNLLVANVDIDNTPPPCLLRGNIDGIIFHGRVPEDFYNNYIRKFPHVGIQHYNPRYECNWVKNDNENIAFQAVRHLYELGHRRIGFVTDYIEGLQHIERYQGYRKALELFGIQPDISWSALWQRQRKNGILPMENTIPDYTQRITELMNYTTPPTALICCDTVKSQATMNALQYLGLSVPADVSIITTCNDFAIQQDDFIWTAVNDRFHDVCAQAARLLLDIIDGKMVDNVTILVRPKLHEGATTAPPGEHLIKDAGKTRKNKIK